MPSYEHLRRRHVADAAAMLPDHVERLGWPADRLAVHRRDALRRLVRTAQDRSPWHRRRLAGVDPERLDEEGLTALPVMTKDDLMDNFDAAHPLIADPQGRLDDTFSYGDLIVHPLVFRSPLGRRRHIVEYQVRQTNRGADIVIRATGPVDLDDLHAELVAKLAAVGLADPEVSIVTVDHLGRQDTGKLKRFIPLRPALVGLPG